MTANISISWHMNESGAAIFRPSSHGGALLRIHEGGSRSGYPKLNIYMQDATRARLAAAAINGDLAELLERALQMANDIGDSDEFGPPICHDALQLAGDIGKVLGERKPAKADAA